MKCPGMNMNVVTNGTLMIESIPYIYIYIYNQGILRIGSIPYIYNQGTLKIGSIPYIYNQGELRIGSIPYIYKSNQTISYDNICAVIILVKESQFRSTLINGRCFKMYLYHIGNLPFIIKVSLVYRRRVNARTYL